MLFQRAETDFRALDTVLQAEERRHRIFVISLRDMALIQFLKPAFCHHLDRSRKRKGILA